ncbi:MAG: hypothetical protein M0Z30_22135 [Actinomycetota bacterium]|nr:hypothetical protein [Actinomycetota bacterium]
MSRPGLYDRLRRLGVPPRTATGVVLDETTVKAALDTHGSISAAAKALHVPRARLGAEAVRLGLRPPPPSIPPDVAEVYQQLGNVDAVVAHYATSPITAARWLRSAGVTLRPGRRPRDG